MAKNPFAHIELNTGNPGQAKTFYKKLFDWKLTDMPMGPGSTYTLIDAGEGPGGGMQKIETAGAPPQWIPYVEVKDVEESIAKASKLGAKVVVPLTDIGEMGQMAIVIDSEGNRVGLHRARS